ncbi:MAG: hypothetical protein ACI9SG_001744 [Maribacter sp.]|jgi:hypothetical protein
MDYYLGPIVNSNFNEVRVSIPWMVLTLFPAGCTVFKYGIMLFVKNKVLHQKVFLCSFFRM